MTGFPATQSALLTFDAVVAAVDSAAEIAYEVDPSGNGYEKRLVEYVKQRYYQSDTLGGPNPLPLPFGEVDVLAKSPPTLAAGRDAGRQSRLQRLDFTRTSSISSPEQRSIGSIVLSSVQKARLSRRTTKRDCSSAWTVAYDGKLGGNVDAAKSPPTLAAARQAGQRLRSQHIDFIR